MAPFRLLLRVRYGECDAQQVVFNARYGAGGFKTIASHDPLLLNGYPGFIGGKTGYTNLAQETYVAMAQRDGKQLIAVMMYGKDDLWDQGRALLDWGFAQR